MPDPAWPSSTPEVNHLRLVGAGAGGIATTLASSAAWQAVTAASQGACSLSAANTACTAPGFAGIGGAASASLATGLNGALQLLAAWTQEKTAIAAAGVSAYQTAVSAMIPAAVAAANRTQQASNVAMNPLVFGALTPAIIALDTTYFGEYWPHNAAVGAAYGAALAALTTALAVPPPSLLTGNATAGPAGAAEAVSQAVGQAAAGEATKASGDLGNRTGIRPEVIAETLAQPLSGMASPIGSLGGTPPPGMFQAPQALSGLTAAAGMLPQLGMDDRSEAFGDVLMQPTTGWPAAPATVAGGAAATGVGQPGAPVATGIGPSATPTSYVRPAAAFPAASGAQALGTRGGEPLSAPQQGPAGAGVGGVPAALTQRDKSLSDKAGVARNRVVLGATQHPDAPD